MIACERHSGSTKPWIVCVHVADQGVPPASAQRVEQRGVGGEILCQSCKALLDRHYPEEVSQHLRLACEACVLERWRLVDAN